MATKKKATAAKKPSAAKTNLRQQDADQPTQTQEPHEINDSLASDRMKALLEDHRKMGVRP